MLSCHNNFSVESSPQGHAQEDALFFATKISAKLPSIKLELIQGFGRLLQQTYWAGDSPFPNQSQGKLCHMKRPPCSPSSHIPRCSRKFYSRIGLPSHLQSHQRKVNHTVRRKLMIGHELTLRTTIYAWLHLYNIVNLF